MVSRNFFADNPDMQFHFRHLPWQDLASVMSIPADELRSASEEMLQALGEFVANEIAPYTHELDAQRPVIRPDGEVDDAPRMKTVINGLAKLGAMGLTMPKHIGGLGLPWVLSSALFEVLARADVAVMTYYGFCLGQAQVLFSQAIDAGDFTVENGELKSTCFDAQMKPMAQGIEVGAMAITEPGAGSDVSKITTKAWQDDHGMWHVNGQKIWITCGNGEHHLVLARSEDTKTVHGLDGLSLFYVPAHVTRDGQRVRNIEVAGIEKKMGQHSMVTATINYNDSEATLLGKRGRGFQAMLMLMNDARIACGMQGLGLCEAALRMARDFANTRVTMGKPIAEHEIIADYLEDMDTRVSGLRAMTYWASFQEEMATRYRFLLRLFPPTDEQKKREMEKVQRKHRWKSRMLTPLVKYTGAELAVYVARMNMQIMGGVGYMSEYGAEKLLRDALVIPVYEGTSQIQALMAMKDHLKKALRNPALFLAGSAKARFDALRTTDVMESGLARVKAVYFSAIKTILTRIMADKLGDLKGKPIWHWRTAFFKSWDPAKDFSFGLLHAERFTRIAADMAAAKILVHQARNTAKTPDGPWRRGIAERFLARAEPRCRGLLIEIESIRRSPSQIQTDPRR